MLRVMKNNYLFYGLGATLLVIALGCRYQDGTDSSDSEGKAEAKKVSVGKNVFLQVEGDKRRVLINAYVCLREGTLEQFLTRKLTKEHEALLAADIDAREVHTALTLAKAEAGHPVRFRPKYAPATGTPVNIFVEYKNKDGETKRLRAQEWIRSVKTKKTLDHSWVFAGSQLISDPFDKTKKPFYAANDGDVICISNFDTALLDLPISSPQTNDDLIFEANTEALPPLNTPVLVILEPVANAGTQDTKKK